MSRPNRIPILPLLTVALALITPSLLPAQQGGLLVAPTRLVFEGRSRGGEVTLVNSGTETTTYRIEVIRLRMKEDGSFEDVVEPQAGERFANDLIRYSPRQVTLDPGVPQTVRVQLRLPAALEEGEYRSHLLFRAIPPIREVDSGAVHPWHHLLDRYRQPHGMTSRFGVFDALGEAYWNSARPYGQNDGAVWQGKGGTVAFSVGVFARYGVVSGVLRPSFIHTANAGFELSALPVASGRSPYAYSLRPDIDTPQRFGTDPYSTVDLGQSYLRIDYKGLVKGSLEGS